MNVTEMKKEVSILNGLKDIFGQMRNGNKPIAAKELNGLFEKHNMYNPMPIIVRRNLLRKGEKKTYWWNAFDKKSEPIMPNLQMARRVQEDTQKYKDRNNNNKQKVWSKDDLTEVSKEQSTNQTDNPIPQTELNFQSKMNNDELLGKNDNCGFVEDKSGMINGHTEPKYSPYSAPGIKDNPKSQQDVIVLKIPFKFIQMAKQIGVRLSYLVIGALLWELIQRVSQLIK